VRTVGYQAGNAQQLRAVDSGLGPDLVNDADGHRVHRVPQTDAIWCPAPVLVVPVGGDIGGAINIEVDHREVVLNRGRGLAHLQGRQLGGQRLEGGPRLAVGINGAVEEPSALTTLTTANHNSDLSTARAHHNEGRFRLLFLGSQRKIIVQDVVEALLCEFLEVPVHCCVYL